MFRTRTLKFLGNFALLLMLCTTQVSARSDEQIESSTLAPKSEFNLSEEVIPDVDARAKRDIILVMDTSGSMAYQTRSAESGGNIWRYDPDSPGLVSENPEVCNMSVTAPCQPMNAVKESALSFIDALDFGYDRVGIIAWTGQETDGSAQRYPVQILALSSDETAIRNAITGLKVFQPHRCDLNLVDFDPDPGACLLVVQDQFPDQFVGVMCQSFEMLWGTGDYNPAACPSANIGGALRLAGEALSGTDSRPDANWVALLLATGTANATDTPENLPSEVPPEFPYGYCPKSTYYPNNGHTDDIYPYKFCTDGYPSIRHDYEHTSSFTYNDQTFIIRDYDPDDYARDRADQLATLKPGDGVSIFTIGLGSEIRETDRVAPGEPPAGENLLQYIAECAGDDCGTTVNHGAYYYAPTKSQLDSIFSTIAAQSLRIIYTKWDATGTNDGTSWANAYTDLQSAISAAASGDEIWVTAGTYKPTTGTDRTISFALKNEVAIYGGFAGTETQRTQRNPTSNTTVLSGNINDIEISADNSFNVVTANGVNSNTILDGLTISDGSAGHVPPYDAGGGLNNTDGNLTLTNVIFRDNFGIRGGGMYNANNSNPTLTNIMFIDNSAWDEGGGGMYNENNGNAHLVDVSFTGNYSYTNGGGMANVNSNPDLYRVTFLDNRTQGWAGGMYNENSDPLLDNILFRNNTAAAGGGILNNSSNPDIFNATFDSNTAADGGGIHNILSSPVIVNSTFYGNRASRQVGEQDLGYGGGIYNSSDSVPLLRHATMIDNYAGGAGDAISNHSNPVDGSSIVVQNSIIWGNTIFGPSTVTYSIVQGGYAGMGNLFSNPLLGTLSDNGGFTQTFALLPGSPAIDSADDTNCPLTDQRGMARPQGPQGAQCDIGAYEAENPPLIVTNANDTNDGICDTDCSLREAITMANGSNDIDTIQFAADYTITLGNQLPAITTPMMISGHGAANTIIQANADSNTATYRVFEVSASGDLTLNNLTIRHGRCDLSCTVLDAGAGLYNNGGIVTITASTFSNNSSTDAGAAITNSNGQMTISNSTITHNSATGNTAGGIYNNGTLDIYNSTISNNTSTSSIWEADNIYQGSGALNLYNTIIANSATHGDCGIGGGTIAATNSLIESTGAHACGLTNGMNGNIIGSNPNLGSLTGSPAYFPLNTGSPAINAGDDDVCTATPVNNTSQNGVIRPQESHCDIGAFEKPDTISPSVNSSVRVNSNPTALSSVNFTLTFSEPVIGVDTGDIGLTTTGTVNNAATTNVVGSGSTYTVTVNTGSGNGTIRLDVLDDNSIMDVSTNPLGGVAIGDGDFTTGEVYSIDKGGDTTGVFRPSNGVLFMKNANTSGFADIAINYGAPGDYPVTGDWDGNGTATIGIYRSGSFFLRNSNTLGFADLVFAFGLAGDQPIAGDWDGDGTDTIGIFRPTTGQFLLRNTNSAGVPDASFFLGNAGDVGIAGDWNGDGLDTTGVFRPSNGVLFMKNANTSGFADIAINYGIPGDQPVTGDWNSDGIDTIGVYRNGQFLLRNSNTLGFADIVFALGVPGDMPIAGNWDGLP